MEILEFANIQRRMCKTYDCTGCPLNNRTCRIGMGSAENDEEIINIVEKWAAYHPVKTRQSEFLKLFPHASIHVNGQLQICPKTIDTNYECNVEKAGNCNICESKYWLEEIE